MFKCSICALLLPTKGVELDFFLCLKFHRMSSCDTEDFPTETCKGYYF